MACTWLKWPFMIYSFQASFGYNTHCNNSGRLGEFIVYVAFGHIYFWCQKFSFLGTKKWHQKTALENGVVLWHRFLDHVSCVWVMEVVDSVELFAADKGTFFPKWKEDTGYYVYRCSDRVKAWLRKLHTSGKKLFVLSSSLNDFVCASLQHILGFVFSCQLIMICILLSDVIWLQILSVFVSRWCTLLIYW